MNIDNIPDLALADHWAMGGGGGGGGGRGCTEHHLVDLDIIIIIQSKFITFIEGIGKLISESAFFLPFFTKNSGLVLSKYNYCFLIIIMSC